MQLSSSLLTFRFSSTIVENGVAYSADKCNNGVLTDLCHTEYGYNNPSLTILSTALFDTVKVYNRVGSCLDRIQGASITTTVNGYSFLATFPQSAHATFTFSVPSIPSNSPTVTQSSIPTVTRSSSPTALPSSAPTIIPHTALIYAKYLSFSGENSYAYTSLPQALNSTFSFSAWITTNSHPASIVSLGRSASSSSGEFVLEINRNGNLHFMDYSYSSSTKGSGFSVLGGKVINSSAGNGEGEMTNRIDDYIYLNFCTNNVDIVSRVHVAASRNGFECSLYINGQPAGRGISTVSVSYQNAFLVFGVDYRNNSNHFTGTMSDISIYSQSLSDSEILSLYNSQVGSTGSVFSPTLSPSNSATGVVQTGGDGGGGGENVGCNIYCIIGSIFGWDYSWYTGDLCHLSCLLPS